MRIKYFLICVGLFLQANAALTQSLDAAMVTFGFWGNDTNRHGARLSARWDWGLEGLKGWPLEVTGYWEAGLGYWQANAQEPEQNTHLAIASASPVLQFWFGPIDTQRDAVFIDVGVGPAYFTNDQLGSKNFGSRWHFEDKLGAGIHLGTPHPIEIIYRYYHYSNAGIVGPNNGLDLSTIGFVFFF